MTDQNDEAQPKIALGRLEWGVIIALIMSAGTTLFSAGIVYGDVRDQGRRLAIIENKTDNADQRAAAIGERLARIESNIDFLVEQYKTDRNAPRPQ